VYRRLLARFPTIRDRVTEARRDAFRMPGETMIIKTFADLILRVAAALTAIGLFWIVLIVGIMANDAGTRQGATASVIILLIGGAIGLWVLACSIRPNRMWPNADSKPILHFAAVKLPTYLFGAAGCWWLISWAHQVRQKPFYELREVKVGAALFPAVNPNPAQVVTISGTLPSNVPVKDFAATYETTTNDKQADGPCQIRPESLPTEPASSRTTTVAVPVVRADGRYRASLMLDWFVPGSCGWHLTAVGYRLFLSGYEYPEGMYGERIYVVDNPEALRKTAKNETYRGPIHVWCRKNDNFANNHSYPELCGAFEASFPTTYTQITSVPNNQKEYHGEVYIYPGTTAIEFNFHDSDAVHQ
jgi:hypothetical protein